MALNIDSFKIERNKFQHGEKLTPENLVAAIEASNKPAYHLLTFIGESAEEKGALTEGTEEINLTNIDNCTENNTLENYCHIAINKAVNKYITNIEAKEFNGNQKNFTIQNLQCDDLIVNNVSEGFYINNIDCSNITAKSVINISSASNLTNITTVTASLLKCNQISASDILDSTLDEEGFFSEIEFSSSVKTFSENGDSKTSNIIIDDDTDIEEINASGNSVLNINKIDVDNSTATFVANINGTVKNNTDISIQEITGSFDCEFTNVYFKSEESIVPDEDLTVNKMEVGNNVKFDGNRLEISNVDETIQVNYPASSLELMIGTKEDKLREIYFPDFILTANNIPNVIADSTQVILPQVNKGRYILDNFFYTNKINVKNENFKQRFILDFCDKSIVECDKIYLKTLGEEFSEIKDNKIIFKDIVMIYRVNISNFNPINKSDSSEKWNIDFTIPINISTLNTTNKEIINIDDDYIKKEIINKIKNKYTKAEVICTDVKTNISMNNLNLYNSYMAEEFYYDTSAKSISIPKGGFRIRDGSSGKKFEDITFVLGKNESLSSYMTLERIDNNGNLW